MEGTVTIVSTTSTARQEGSLPRQIIRSRLTFFVLGVVVLATVLNVGRIFHSDALEPGDLYILSGADDSVGHQREQLLRAWNDLHPTSKAYFKLASAKADDQHSAMVADAQIAESTVDIYNLDVTWVPEFAGAGYIRKLGSVETSGFLEKPLSTGYYGGGLYALPFNTDAGLLYYRTDLLQPEDVPTQLPPSSAQVKAMMGRDPSLKAGYATQLATYEGLTVNALESIWAVNGDVVGADGRLVSDLTSAQAGLKRLADGVKGARQSEPGLLFDSRSATEKQTTAAFAAGQVALMRNWPVAFGQLSDLAQQKPGGFDITGKFAVRKLAASVLGGQDLAISQHTSKPKAAAALIQFLTSAESEIKLYRDGGLAPTKGAAYDDPGARLARTGAFTDTLRAAVQDARSRPSTTHYQLFSSVFQDEVNYAIDHDGALPPRAKRDLADALDGKLE
jgi:ABC-type glycerol-3-phosphate transport system substrate-binding protein